MNHFMLAAPTTQSSGDSWAESGRYGSFAMEMLINGILKRGGNKTRLEAKVFGGGKIYDGAMDVGAKECRLGIGLSRTRRASSLESRCW